MIIYLSDNNLVWEASDLLPLVKSAHGAVSQDLNVVMLWDYQRLLGPLSKHSMDPQEGQWQCITERTMATASSTISSRASFIDVAETSSISSLNSLISTAPTSQSTLSSVQIGRAMDELVSIFHNDHELGALYRSATTDTRIEPPRLERNFKRLLMSFAHDLKDEARESADVALANLISIKAGVVAARLSEKTAISSPHLAS